MRSKKYMLTLPYSTDYDLKYSSDKLGISLAETIRRALRFIKHAAAADKITLFYADGSSKNVILR